MAGKTHFCIKNPTHAAFISIVSLKPDDMPRPFSDDPRWSSMLRARADDTVKLSVTFTCDNRPEPFKCSRSRARQGTGTIFWTSSASKSTSYAKEGSGDHGVNGPLNFTFRVVTVAHLVYDKDEALSTTVEFFDDYPDNSFCVRTAQVVDFIKEPEESGRSILVCVTHDKEILERLERSQRQRNQLLEQLQEPEGASMCVIISHPHGMSKQISFGELVQVDEFGPVKTVPVSENKQMLLRDCILQYSTPSCPGSGGGSVTVWQRGKRAFAPHCKTVGPGRNQSALGWVTVSHSCNGN